MPETTCVLTQIAAWLSPDYATVARLPVEALAALSWQTLGMDSLELATLVLHLEAAWGCTLSNTHLGRVVTFGDLAALVVDGSTCPPAAPGGTPPC